MTEPMYQKMRGTGEDGVEEAEGMGEGEALGVEAFEAATEATEEVAMAADGDMVNPKGQDKAFRSTFCMSIPKVRRLGRVFCDGDTIGKALGQFFCISIPL